MKVFIDSNIISSAAKNPQGKPFLAFCKAVSFPNSGMVCDQNIDEIRRVFYRKFPHQISLLEHFFAETLPFLSVVPIPAGESDDEEKIRDADDRPILRAAINADADIFITGDKDFLESAVVKPKIVTAAQFLEMNI
jgi:putative PIN family toxin of toxin-antitoxin system